MTGQASQTVLGGGEEATFLTAAAIAVVTGGRLVGDPDARVEGIAPLDRAGERELSFLASAKYTPLFAKSKAAVVLVAPELADAVGRARARVIVEAPHEALLRLLPTFHRPVETVRGIHPTAVLGRGVTLGSEVSVGPYAAIGRGATIGDRTVIGAQCAVGADVVVGRECRLFPTVTLYEGARLGDRVIVHAGARVASDGFGYVFRDGTHAKLPHVGRCVIEDDVEIGANSTLDRGSIDDTVVGAGTKIDNLVHVAHNVRIGRLCLIMAQVGIAGSVRIEDGCIVAGQVGIAGHRTIGKGARLAARAGVFGDIPAGETWSGYPARPHRESLRAHAALFKLAGIIRDLERLVRERA